MDQTPATARVLDEVGPRLRQLRSERGVTLAGLSEATGISKSTLSRLESGQRKPSLELLLPIAQAHQVALDELVGSEKVGDPRVRSAPREANGMTSLPLTRNIGPLQAFKMIISPERGVPEPETHEGYEWLYVLSGKLRLILAEHDLVLKPGEAAEFDCRVPHAFYSADDKPVEVLSLFGRQGERMHIRAKPRRKDKE
ncbi:helix-turn-helix domain-containing protein [Actinomadura barringtoniae]|uniref:helix-turn-helix domain-containing protein n=1 Tax=Actinomadura barringtoniae TaxID=1427535 RepID=UPI0027DE8B3C|nr:XRE family transcriptional regulator [Actinomadura barringtoniae]